MGKEGINSLQPCSSVTITNLFRNMQTALGLGEMSGVSKQGRHAGALFIQSAGVPMDQIVKHLTHAAKTVAAGNYATLPSRMACRRLNGWPKEGIPTIPRHALHNDLRSEKYSELVESVIPFFKQYRAKFNSLPKEQQNNQDHHFLMYLRECICGLIETVAEILILDPNRSGRRAKMQVFNYAPFNGGAGSPFMIFVEALKLRYTAIKSSQDVSDLAIKKVALGDVKSGFEGLASVVNASSSNIAALASKVETLTSTVERMQSGGGGGGAASGSSSSGGGGGGATAAAASGSSSSTAATAAATTGGGTGDDNEIDYKDPSTWPSTHHWLNPTNFQLRPKANMKYMKDVHEAYYTGWKGYPAIKSLNEKYPHGRWKKQFKRDRINKIGKIAIHLEAPGATEQYQQELYTSRSDKPKEKLQSWAALNRFLEDVITKRQPDYAAKRDKMMAVRAVRADGGKSGGSGSGSTGGKSGTGGKSFGTPSLNGSTNL